MTLTRYAALLRGINVGGKNIVGMAALKEIFEGAGHDQVSTYIQSGNVLFETRKARGRLVSNIEQALSETLGMNITVVLRSHEQLASVVADAPAGFGSEPKEFRYDVIFLKEPVKASEAINVVPTKESVDEVFAGDGVLYFSRLISRATQSRMSRIIGLPVYKSMTIRNWNTTTKLLILLDARAAAK